MLNCKEAPVMKLVCYNHNNKVAQDHKAVQVKKRVDYIIHMQDLSVQQVVSAAM